MVVEQFPTQVMIGGEFYRVAGFIEGLPRWESTPEPAQPGEFATERPVRLGDGAAGIIGGRRFEGRPSADGVADVTNGDVSVRDVYGAGPLITAVSLTSGNSFHAAGSIGGSLEIGGGSGAPSIGAGAFSGTPTAIWADGVDANGQRSRYIYTVAGGRMKVVDPTDDSVVETVEWTGVDGADEAYWAGVQWIARRGGAADFVQYVTVPYDGTQTTLATADFTARTIHAGPDAIYRGYSDFAGNSAIVKKSDSATPAAVALDANWAPSNGQTIGDPGVGITRLATLGERLVIGKENGLAELDADFTRRQFLEWMAAFAWENNCNAIVPVGTAGEVIVGFRRGLYILPVNEPIGTEVLPDNSSDKKGRYTYLGYDGNWFYGFLESPATDDTHIIKMRPRRRGLPGPGLFEQCPIATLVDTEVLTGFLWPGATVGGTIYGPRFWFGNGENSLAYFRLGETQPDQQDANARFTSGAWSIQWPDDDFGSTGTLKSPHRLGSTYDNVAGTTGITWAVSADGGATFVSLTADGASGAAAVTADGYTQRFGPRDNSVLGRSLIYRISGTGGSTTAQQRILGQPDVTILEQPEMVDVISTVLQLEQVEGFNDNPADAQLRTLQNLKGQAGQAIQANFGDDVPGVEFYGRVGEAKRVRSVTRPDAGGVILVQVALRTLDYAA